MLGNQIRVLVNRWDFSSGFFNIETERQVEEKDNTTFTMLATSAEPGLSSDQFRLRGYYTSAQADTVYKELSARIGVEGRNTGMGILIDNTDANCLAIVSPDAWGQLLKVNLVSRELITFDINTPNATSVFRGLRLHEGAITRTGVESVFDLGAGGTEGGAAFIFVRTVAPAGSNLMLRVSSSTTENGTYTSRAVLNYNTTGFLMVPFSGAIDRWVRLTTENMGGATSSQVCVIVAVKGVTY